MLRSFGWSDTLFLLQGALWTLALSFAAFAFGSLIGAVVCWLRMARNPVARVSGALLVQIVQSVPPLILLFLTYFGLSLAGYNVNAFVAATAALGLFAAVYLGEIWRGSITSITRTQWEAAEALALTRFDQLVSVILPQAVRIAIPPTVGFLVQLIKNTSLASVVGYVELIKAGQLINNATFQSLKVFGIVCVIYFCICFPLSRLSRRLELTFGRA